jgi:hypothetical protein
MIPEYDTIPPDPKKYGKGWEFKVPEMGEEFLASDLPWRRLARCNWEPKKDRFEGKRWSRDLYYD